MSAWSWSSRRVSKSFTSWSKLETLLSMGFLGGSLWSIRLFSPGTCKQNKTYTYRYNKPQKTSSQTTLLKLIFLNFQLNLFLFLTFIGSNYYSWIIRNFRTKIILFWRPKLLIASKILQPDLKNCWNWIHFL